MITVCTIAARNYLAHVRVLAASVRQHHPDARFVFLVIDDEARQFDAAGEPYECVRLSDLGLDRAEIRRLAAIYDVTELATAVKPPFLRYLLGQNRGGRTIIYLDPDIKVYRSLEHIAQLASEHSIVLTPHVTHPMPRDNRRIDEFQILASGIYNLGFLAVGPGCDEFLDWWWTKTRREARSDPAKMMFTDQRWVDFVPSFWRHFILRDTSCNVAYWNLHGRELIANGTGYRVDGEPLTFFHFSGFDTRTPYLLSKHQGDRPRVLISERPALQCICEEYLADLYAAGHGHESKLPYGWSTLPSGQPFTARLRQLYRTELGAYEQGKGPEPPCPFDEHAPERFVGWLSEPVAVGVGARLPRYLDAIYQARDDLRTAFPNLAGDDGPRFLDWVRQQGFKEEWIPDSLRQPDLTTTFDLHSTFASSGLSNGVNIVGYLRAELGVGEAARLLTTAVEAAGIPHSTINYGVTRSRTQHAFEPRGDGRAEYDINILCVNADQTPIFAREAGPRFFEGRYTAGYWFWELEQFPESMHDAFDYVDEVWTATRFVADGVRAPGRRPVYTIPPPLAVPQCARDITRQTLDLPPGFLFLYVFDFFSVVERKNPLGLIEAFQRAFRPDEGPILVIKTINGESRLSALEQVRAAARDRADILVIDRYYSHAEKNSLLGLCDCYVSLHRSEGLGLTIAEAMALEKPVIATAYSGNLDFMTPENSYLVDYVKREVPDGCLPYPKGTPWAEPDLDQAASYMRRVVETPREAMTRARAARHDILTRHNARAAGAAVAARLHDIRRTRAQKITDSRSRGAHQPVAASATTAAHAEPALLMPSSEVERLLTPAAGVTPERSFRAPLQVAQRLLFRILRPYWFQQRQAHQTLFASIRSAFEATLAEQQLQRRTLETQWQTLQTLQTQLAASNAAAAANAKALTTFQQSATAHLQALTAFQESAAAHLKALTERLATLGDETTTLSNRLYAAPFTNPPGRFSYATPDGKRVLGYCSAREQQGDLYPGFESIFRGSEPFIQARFQSYMPVLTQHDHVVDIGCGRGELLDILREAGIAATGVDFDSAMVRRCREKGHDVEHTDLLSFLQRQGDLSLSAIFAAQVVEHLSYQDLIAFIQYSHAKLRHGGRLVFETVNPHALEAFKTFFTDLTHQRPIFPEVALAWCWLLGFDSAYVFFPNGDDDLDRDIKTQGEYAIIASKK
jgi:glycosyltransferase involved in cell wall biosynthesis/2-polyprenyl-3-methyl-5-hydroxy-6-metoxy-1,4-benzoquinol methylase